MLQLEPKLPDVTELDVLKKDNSPTQTSVVIDDSKKKDSESSSSVGVIGPGGPGATSEDLL